jgi:hypothetical protein
MTVDPLDMIPFQFLSSDDRAWLLERLTEHVWADGDTVLAQGDTTQDTHLLVKGAIEVEDDLRPEHLRVLARIEAPAYFGERAALFGQRRGKSIRAAGPVVTRSMSGSTFFELVERSEMFAAGLARVLRDKQAIFGPLERFLAELRGSAARGYIVIPRLLHLYKRMQPAIHVHVNDEEIDFNGLTYALRRLPTDITQVFSWFLTFDLPTMYSSPDEVFVRVDTKARRRAVWQMMPGKLLVLLRDHDSDLVDLVTCMCVYAVEARKLRRRLRDPSALRAVLRGAPLADLPLSEEEVTGLEQLWGDQASDRLCDIARHHEDSLVHVYRAASNYNPDHSERWTSQLADAVEQLMGAPLHALPDLPVHIISSNTHSVTNCLSPWMQAYRDEILEWGRAHCGDWCELSWGDERDLAVALSRRFLAAHPERKAQRYEMEHAGNTVHLTQTAFTGIEVQLFDTGEPGLIVNIDYAFGQQAGRIISNLISLFGQRIVSVSVLGKGGGLCGDRGDVFAATEFVDQADDLLLSPEVAVDEVSLRGRLGERNLRVGRALTVAGTLLQDRVLLQYYRTLWGCVGLEMEGAFYCRGLLEARQRNLVRSDIKMQFLYYVSDLPLDPDETLAEALSAHEGVPPLYAITREVLEPIVGVL